MAEFIPSSIELNTEILGLMESISRRQGEISASKRSIQEERAIEAVSSVDAVHFSTKIEGNLLTRDQVTKALKSGKLQAPAHDLKEILNYARARRLAREWILKGRSFNDEWVLVQHTELLKGIVKGKLRGHYREAQCVIQDSKTREVIYLAPEWQDVPKLMGGLLQWMRQKKLERHSPLLLAAQFHFEFVTIHPFMDGNGRLARLLTNGVLTGGGYDVERYAALEKQHERNRSAYYGALRSLQTSNFYDIQPGQNIGSWVHYWLKCLLETYEEAFARTSNAKPAVESSNLPELDDRLHKAESLFRRHQKLRAGEYADLMGLGRTQAVADLNALVKSGILKRIGGGRSTLYRWIEKIRRK